MKYITTQILASENPINQHFKMFLPVPVIPQLRVVAGRLLVLVRLVRILVSRF